MNLNSLFGAIDAKPFHPFFIGLTSGEKISVAHPDNIYVLPTRSQVHHIEVYRPVTWEFVMIYPEALAGLFLDGNGRDPAKP